ncbi:hypothetical protein [Catenuloplanes japonicus]|uniref:hypothetical protein n=1 Tax=Catenuloplanes japonicus TaxID=33876 RepID=UPI0005241E48|nr:hypothetical protein [Catenuloplanes japonicus]
MHTTPIMIHGVAGWVSVTLPPIGRAALTVNGMPAQRLRGSDWLLPGITGTPILVKLKRGFADPFPTIQSIDAAYPTGPALPGFLRTLLLLPVLLIPFSGLLLGAIFGVPAFIANMSVGRSELTNGVKGVAMAAINLCAILGLVALIGALVVLSSLVA